MRFFQWMSVSVKDAVRFPVRILRQVFQPGTSESSLLRKNHELIYKVEALKIQNKKLSEALEAVKDENVLLWQHMDELKEAEKAVMQSLADEIEESMLKNLVPVGDA